MFTLSLLNLYCSMFLIHKSVSSRAVSPVLSSAVFRMSSDDRFVSTDQQPDFQRRNSSTSRFHVGSKQFVN